MEVENHLWKTCIILCELTSSRPPSPGPYPIRRDDRDEIEAHLGIKKKASRRKSQKKK
tara:strand:+ start:130 stop:303 length:174 start_codon:yes stop_codon:yes gene_type:complete